MALPPTSILATRHTALRRSLDEHGVAALIVSHPANLRYLVNHVGTAGLAVITRDRVHLLIDFRYQTAMDMLQQSPSACPGLSLRGVPGSYEAALLDCLAELELTAVGFEAGHVSVSRHGHWARGLESRGLSTRLTATDGLVERGRAIKDEHEVAALRRAALGLTAVAET
ncbi:MAG: aminopeptidase P family N-terminal domain-containing protein, partial [Vicinamibacteria bacterium]